MKIHKVLRLTVIAVGLMLAACAQTDVGITTKVKAKLIADRTVRDSAIEVSTDKGVVTLTGNIDSEESKERALSLARETTGVVEVRDMIAVRRASGNAESPDANRTLGVTIDDAGITMRVKSRLLEDPLVKGLAIDVDTRAGVVYLTGNVRTAQEKEQAIKLARETQGVADVQANLEIRRG